ncbi:MAG TPA: fluoride efflux transporter CrcB [Casimicrobium huifangae]|jgi:CrcB protein|uniref:fluoride efflux transporter CrcB n=1 Tax=Casimicrobium huifangae TaxID=2591109 RepID=UPI002B8C5E78|nr:fluoride efflux transporter CrcB [Casimicrobium huifangae]HQD65532.1 fluoride efflux transporter CrcB [Casimicrobium huifangae]
MPATLTAIAIGAVLGAWARYGLALAMNGRSWMPWGTFAANAIGGFLIGLALAHLAAKPELSPLWRMFFVTGFLGALTTFSSFSAEVVVLVHDGDLGRALTLAAMHLVASLVLTALGFVVYRSVL